MATSSQEVAAARRWERLASDHPELTQAIDFQRRALALLQGATPVAALPETAAVETRSRFQAGVPLLVAAGARFTGEPPFSLFADLARLAHRSFKPAGARAVERAGRQRARSVEAGLEGALRRNGHRMSAAADEIGAPRDLFTTLCELALTPSFRALAEAAAPILGAVTWTAGYCPLCASWPLFGELREADKSRYLRCGLCGADWGFPRLGCTYCGESDHRRLRAIHVEGESEYRQVELCDSCKGYVKSLARLSPTPPALLAVEDLATAYLDILALEAGYRKPEGLPVFPSTPGPKGP